MKSVLFSPPENMTQLLGGEELVGGYDHQEEQVE